MLALEAGVTIEYGVEVTAIDPCGAPAPASEAFPIPIPKPSPEPQSNRFNKHIYSHPSVLRSSTPPPPTLSEKSSYSKLKRSADPYALPPPEYDLSSKFTTSATTIISPTDSIDPSRISHTACSRRPLIKLASGKEIRDVDVVIGADGIFSTVRQIIFGDRHPEEKIMRQNGWREGGVVAYQWV